MITAQSMREVANKIKEELPKGYGFALVVFETGDGLRNFNYVSNCEREDMIATFEALLIKWKNQNDKNN